MRIFHLQSFEVLTLSAGETIPIRLFLGGFDLTPTFREVNKKYSTRYYLSLVLIDEGQSNPLTSSIPLGSSLYPCDPPDLRLSAIDHFRTKGDSHPTPTPPPPPPLPRVPQ